MKRAWVMVLSASGLILGGCGLHDYEERLKATETTMRHKQALDANLVEAVKGKFTEYNVYLRVPKPLTESTPAFTPLPGAFDHVASFQGTPPAPEAKEGAPATPPPGPLKVHVFIRNKPKKATAKKGQPAPADPNAALRGDFVADVRQLLATYGPEAAEKSLGAEKKGDTSYKKLVFKDAGTGDDIRVYFAATKDNESQVALIYDIPASLRTLPIVTKGVEYSLESFAIGRQAAELLKGGGERGASGKSEGPGSNF